MQTVYNYIEKVLQDSHHTNPWRLSYVSVSDQVILQVYLPVEGNEQITFLNHQHEMIGQVDYLELKFIFTTSAISDYTGDGVYVIKPLRQKGFEIGYLDILLWHVNQVIQNANLQIKELLSGERLEIDVAWSQETVDQMVQTRKDTERFNDTILSLGDDSNDLV